MTLKFYILIFTITIGASSSLKLEPNLTYDYVDVESDVDNSETVDHQGYHSSGPLRGSKSGPMKAKPPGSVGRMQDTTVLYEAPTTTHKSKVRVSKVV